MELPKKKIAPLNTNPRNMILFSKPKTGKTTIVSELENCLILDLEKGSDFVSALKVKISSMEDLKEVGEEIKTQNYPYDYIATDTITALEDLCIEYGEVLYSKTPMGKNWFEPGGGKSKYGNILAMPEGAGYRWQREAYLKAIEYIETLAPTIIFLGHVKDIVLDKNGSQVSVTDIQLTGKLKHIACSRSDAIGYMYRSGDKNMLSFKTTTDVLCGSRSPHLSGQEFLISEKTPQGVITHWDQIFIK